MKQLAEYKLTWGERHELKGQQNTLIKQLYFKFFKEMTDEIVERIKIIEDESILDHITAQILFISSLDELKLPEPA